MASWSIVRLCWSHHQMSNLLVPSQHSDGQLHKIDHWCCHELHDQLGLVLLWLVILLKWFIWNIQLKLTSKDYSQCLKLWKVNIEGCIAVSGMEIGNRGKKMDTCFFVIWAHFNCYCYLYNKIKYNSTYDCNFFFLKYKNIFKLTIQVFFFFHKNCVLKN